MLIYVKIIKKIYGWTDGQPKTIVRNLTKYNYYNTEIVSK